MLDKLYENAKTAQYIVLNIYCRTWSQFLQGCPQVRFRIPGDCVSGHDSISGDPESPDTIPYVEILPKHFPMASNRYNLLFCLIVAQSICQERLFSIYFSYKPHKQN